MKLAGIILLLCAGAALILTVSSYEQVHGPFGYCATFQDGHFPSVPLDSRMTGLLSVHDGTEYPEKTALFSKYVSADIPFIMVDLNSDDPSDPLSLTIITPDKTLGPYYDESDGRVDGRIFLKITRSDGMTPGLWKFSVRSTRNISIGSMDTSSWIRTGDDDHKADE